MKLWIISDLHCESCPFVPNAVPEHDVLVIAGDISNGPVDAFIALRDLRQSTGRPIIFVPGNHDIFGDPIDVFDVFEIGGVHTLSSGQSVIIDNTRFVGATLWTDFALADDVYASESWAARHMPEYANAFAPDGGDLWPAHTRAAHARHKAAIERVLAQPFDGPTAVVTHHAPSPKIIRGVIGIEDAAFASDCELLMDRYRPELWVHGHIHAASDLVFGDTRVVCNPRGYVTTDWKEETGFEEGKIVDVQ
jgi:Icc-related predicted phosphoesterase